MREGGPIYARYCSNYSDFEPQKPLLSLETSGFLFKTFKKLVFSIMFYRKSEIVWRKYTQRAVHTIVYYKECKIFFSFCISQYHIPYSSIISGDISHSFTYSSIISRDISHSITYSSIISRDRSHSIMQLTISLCILSCRVCQYA